MDRGFDVLNAPARPVYVRPLYVSLFVLRVQYNMCTYGLVHVFWSCIIWPATGYVHKLLMCSWLVLCSCFLSRGFQVGVYFLLLVAFCCGSVFCGFSLCTLICNLRTWVSPTVLNACSTDIYI